MRAALLLLLMLVAASGCVAGEKMANNTTVNGLDVAWLGHATFRIAGSVVVYTDPFVIPDAEEKADLILITHDHYDHCDASKVREIAKEDTVIITTQACAPKLEGDVRTLSEGHSLTAKGVAVKAVPAYNPAKPYHPRGAGVGFVFTVDGVKFYIAGDTDKIPEMDSLADENIDVALLPVGGTYTMDAGGAADAVRAIKPRIVIPMHYGAIQGTASDSGNFEELVGDAAEVRVLG